MNNVATSLKTMALALKTILLAMGLYLVWVLVTYMLEGRINTFLRPEDTVDRLVYTVVANLFIGTAVAVWVARRVISSRFVGVEQAGFTSIRRTALVVVIGGLLGFGAYLLQRPPSLNPVVISNAFAQVLAVSIAEVMVCWAVVGTVTESLAKHWGKIVGVIVAILASSVLFGVYHFAHSAPFNTLNMVLLLIVIGAVTSLFYYISRNIYGTIVFHNFQALFGVTQALANSGNLPSYTQPIYPLYVTALIAILVLVVSDLLWVRRIRSEPKA